MADWTHKPDNRNVSRHEQQPSQRSYLRDLKNWDSQLDFDPVTPFAKSFVFGGTLEKRSGRYYEVRSPSRRTIDCELNARLQNQKDELSHLRSSRHSRSESMLLDDWEPIQAPTPAETESMDYLASLPTPPSSPGKLIKRRRPDKALSPPSSPKPTPSLPLPFSFGSTLSLPLTRTRNRLLSKASNKPSTHSTPHYQRVALVHPNLAAMTQEFLPLTARPQTRHEAWVWVDET